MPLGDMSVDDLFTLHHQLREAAHQLHLAWSTLRVASGQIFTPLLEQVTATHASAEAVWRELAARGEVSAISQVPA